MSDIFIAYSFDDTNVFNYIIDGIDNSFNTSRLFYYTLKDTNNISMDEVYKKISEMSFFIILLSNNSLKIKSKAQLELEEAINLKEKGTMKEIYFILIDNNININSDSRIPRNIKNNIHIANTPVDATHIIQGIIQKH